MADLSSVIATGVLTLSGSLGGMWLTQRHAERLARAARTEARRDGARQILIDLLRYGREWADHTMMIVPMYAKFTPQDLEEFANLDSGKAIAQCRKNLGNAFGAAMLHIRDAGLVQQLERAHSLFLHFAEKAIGPVAPSRRRPHGDDLFENVLKGLRHVREFGSSLNELERAAAPLVRTPILDHEQTSTKFSRFWKKVRWRKLWRKRKNQPKQHP